MYLNGSLKGKRIFYVEDNIQNFALVRILLEQQGAKVEVGRWGTDTLSRLEKFLPVDLILVDLMLPDRISGYDVFCQIRSDPRFTNIPIVATSAADPDIEMNKARVKGFAGYIPKPISILQFPQQISTILQGEAVWG
jgi:two-component system, cell cycle response regulator DivK